MMRRLRGRLANASVKTKFTALLIAALVALMPVVVAMTFRNMYLRQQAEITAMLENRAAISAGVIDIVSAGAGRMLAAVAAMPSLADALEGRREDAGSVLEGFFAPLTGDDGRPLARLYYNMYLFDAGLGLVAAADNTLAPLDISDPAFAQNVEAAMRGEGSVSFAARHPVSETVQLLFTAPVLRGGEMLGVVAFLCNTAGFRQYLLWDAGDGDASFVTVADSDGTVFFSGREQYMGAVLDEMGLGLGGKGFGEVFAYGGLLSLATTKPPFGWTIVASVDPRELAGVWESVLAVVAPILLGLLFTAALMSVIAGWALRPLSVLAGDAQKIAMGELDVECLTESKDEISQVYRAFFEIVESIYILKENFFVAENLIKRGYLNYNIKDDRLHGAYLDILNMTNSVTRQYLSFLDYLYAQVVVVDTEIMVLFANESAVGLAGQSEYVGLPLDEFLGEAVSRHVSAAVWGGKPHFESGVLLRGMDVDLRCIPFEFNGEVLGSVIIIVDVSHIKEVERSLEQAKRDAELANTAKSNFLSKMSHEIRTPMNAIMGMAELILGEDVSGDVRDRALTIKQSSSHLLSIINDILDFSKIESGKMEIVEDDYGLHSVIHDVVGIIKVRMGGSRVDFVVYVDLAIPDTLRGDAVRIRQILLNLLTNAVKFTKKGYIALNITSHDAGQPGAVGLTISIADTGDGIRQEDIPALFEEFRQFDLHKHHKVEGSGLGLPITKSFVELMGGTIEVNSVYGRGSEFVIKVPQKISEESGGPALKDAALSGLRVLYMSERDLHTSYSAKAFRDLGIRFEVLKFEDSLAGRLAEGRWTHLIIDADKAAAAQELIAKLRLDTKLVALDTGVSRLHGVPLLSFPTYFLPLANILMGDRTGSRGSHPDAQAKTMFSGDVSVLVVDDVPTNLKVADGLLRTHGISPDFAESGFRAIEMVRGKKYDILFLDHMMPEMDGIETCRRIRQMPAAEGVDLAGMAIVALTANAVVSARGMFAENGFDDFLSKPIETSKLNAVLCKWIPPEKHRGTKGAAQAPGLPGTAGAHAPSETSAIPEISEISKIEGIDAELGLSRLGGDAGSYVGLVEFFAQDMRKQMVQIQGALERGDTRLYTTYVHAVKSAAANIGAMPMSELASMLEAAGHDGEAGYVAANHGRFVREMGRLLDGIEAFAAARKPQAPAQSFDAEAALETLGRLGDAISNMELALIDELVDGLDARASGNPRLAAIKDMVFVGDYDGALAEIGKTLAGGLRCF